MTKIKICGITNLKDALAAVQSGADALGFNFYRKSPRYISPGGAAEIIRDLPEGVARIGVFVNQDIQKIVEIAVKAGLDGIQLHGDESSEFISDLRNFTDLEIIKALRVSHTFSAGDVLKYAADAILLDTYSKAEYGGTGETFNWDIALKVKSLIPKLYLAGGLSPENAADAIRKVHPYAVDACSLLEREPGLKNNTTVRAFIKAVKGVYELRT